MKGLMSFDKLNNTQTGSSGSGDSGAGSGVDFGSLAEGADEAQAAERKINPILENIKKRLGELGELFKNGFRAGLGSDFEDSLKRTMEHLQGIKDSLVDIFTDPKVVAAANKCADKIACALGQTAGAAVSIGQTIIENLAGGIDYYLKQNSGYIKERLVGIFDATGEIAELGGNFAETFAYIFEVFRGDTAKQCTSDIIGIFSNAFLGIIQLGLEFKRDILNCIVQPIIDNKDKIRDALENTLKPVSTVLSTLNTSVKAAFDKIFEVYDAKVRPAFEGIADGISSLLGTILDNYNQYIAPVLDELADKFSEVWQEHFQPVIDKTVELFGKLAECIAALWQNVIVPFAEWIISNIIPVLAPVIESIGETVLNVYGAIADTIGGVIDVLGGVLDFMTGIFSGDWDKCWEGVVSVVTGVGDIIAGTWQRVCEIVSGIVEAIILAVSGLIRFMVEAVAAKWQKIEEDFRQSGEAVKSIFTGIKDCIILVFSTLWNTLKRIINSILGGIDKMVNGVVKGVNGIIRTLNGLKFDIPDWIPGAGGKSFGFNIGQIPEVSIPRLAKGGIISSPTLAMMGENSKKEAVVPLDRNLEWRDAIADKIIEKTGANGGGLTASEMRSIMLEMINAFAQLIAGLDLTATLDTREAYRAMKKEYNIENKPKGKRLD